MSYRTIINVNKLAQFYFLMFNFSKLDSNTERKLDAYFRLHNNITFANRTIGEYSVISVVFAKDTKEFKDTFTPLFTKESESKKSIVREFPIETIKIDDIDKEIPNILEEVSKEQIQRIEDKTIPLDQRLESGDDEDDTEIK